jgi:hypothetical protein
MENALRSIRIIAVTVKKDTLGLFKTLQERSNKLGIQILIYMCYLIVALPQLKF